MIYFDAGATTLEKPAAVGRAMARAAHTMSSPGRGSYPASRLAGETAYLCRQEAAELLGVPQPENVVITGSATHGLNLAIRSLLGPGDRVVISGYEHNAVTRPLHAIPGLSVTVIDTPPFRPDLAAEEFRRAIRQKRPRAVICTHVSNVFGAVLPVEDIARCCRETDTPLIVDASQSAGVLPVDLAGWGAAFVAMPGHKGLYGPQGTGLLLCGVEGKPLLYGGTGSMSRLQDMPPDLPDRLEPGTHNMPGIAGLLEGIRFVRRQGVESIAARERQVALRAARGLESLPGVRVLRDRELPAPDRRGVLRDGGPGLRGGGGGSGPAGHRSAGGASLRAPGPSHGGDPGHRHPAAQRVLFQHAGPGGPPGVGRVPGAS